MNSKSRGRTFFFICVVPTIYKDFFHILLYISNCNLCSRICNLHFTEVAVEQLINLVN